MKSELWGNVVCLISLVVLGEGKGMIEGRV